MKKHCTSCDQNKHILEFSKDRRSKDGLCAWCKDCEHIYGKGYRAGKKSIILQNKTISAN